MHYLNELIGSINDQEIRARMLTGLISVNEARKLMGMAPVKGGGTHLVWTEQGAIPLEHFEEYFKLLAEKR